MASMKGFQSTSGSNILSTNFNLKMLFFVGFSFQLFLLYLLKNMCAYIYIFNIFNLETACFIC